MESKELTCANIELLKKQSFSADLPGAILHDFEVLLDFICQGIPVSKNTHLLQQQALPVINQQLSRPLTNKLKRPLQKSFPPINGLFLLLRASGITRLVVSNKGPILAVEANMLECWHSLTAVEQYFTLLEAWLYRGYPEIIGERSSRCDFGYYFFKCLEFMADTPKEGLNVAANTDRFNTLKYRPGLHNLALMELFGWVQIELDASLAENWPVSKVIPTEWGFSLSIWYHAHINKHLFDDTYTDSISDWDSQLQTYFPGLKHRLIQSQEKTNLDTTIVLKVLLHKAWRLIQVSGRTLFDELASVILDAFDFDNDHLYEFSFKNAYGYSEHIVHPQIESDDQATTECAIGEIELYPGMELLFTFDFGDNWEFLLVVDSINDQPFKAKPKVIDKQGKLPKQYADEWW